VKGFHALEIKKMNTEPIKGSWEEQKQKLKARFLSLTNADLNFETGKSEEMLNRLQIKLGKTRKEMTTILSAL
jgi:hypothetical protein